MAIRTRSKPDQMIPDGLLGKRFDNRVYVVGAQGTPGARFLPLVGSGDTPSAFSEMGTFSLAGANAGYDVPTLQWTKPCWAPGETKGKFGTLMLTATTKMDCPSFSLSAGPPEEGGSCFAARRPKPGVKTIREPGKMFTCDQCYALGANYAQPTVSFAQSARLWWVLQELERDPTGMALATALVAAISEYARRTSFGRDGMARLVSELGVWQRSSQAPNGAIHVPVSAEVVSKGGRIRLHPGFSTSLPPEFGVPDTNAWFAQRVRPAEGDIAGFFRIHDSGDFNVGNKLSLWIAYVNAWVKVARTFPSVLFWAPTRSYGVPGVKAALVEGMRTTPNFIVRPSALHLNDLRPVIPGLAIGTSVVNAPEKDNKTKKSRTFEAPGDVPCPVYYDHWDPAAPPTTKERMERGETGNWVEVKSCMAAGCRRCWIDTTHGVAYGLH
jgi:hypothetical protein